MEQARQAPITSACEARLFILQKLPQEDPTSHRALNLNRCTIGVNQKCVLSPKADQQCDQACANLGNGPRNQASVDVVLLNNITVNDRKRSGQVEFQVSEADATLALSIARSAVEALEDLGYRIVDAVVPDTKKNGDRGEHDLLAERRGQTALSSIEIKCKTIKRPEKLLEKARSEMREDAKQLFHEQRFTERVVLMFEYGGGPLENGWNMLRIESLSAAGEWRSLRGWGGATAIAVNPVAPVSPVVPATPASRKRKRDSDAAPLVVGKFVTLADERYTTLPQYLGRTAVKSELNLASESCQAGRVEMRRGDWNSFGGYWGKELLPGQTSRQQFQNHGWVETIVANARSDRPAVQVRLLKKNEEPHSSKFLWKLTELEGCRALRRA